MLSPRLLGLLALGLFTGYSRAAGGPSASPAPSKREPGRMVRLDAAEFRKLLEQSGGTLLDVRTPDEVSRGRVANASVIDFYDPRFKQKVELLPKGKPAFVYCASGRRSAAAAELMAQLGFSQVYDLAGGFGSWTSAGYPVERSASAVGNAAKAMEPAALDVLLRTNGRVLVDYQTPWCAPCRAMSPIVDQVAEAWKGRAMVLRVDIGESEGLAAREKVQGVPVFVLYVDGKERWRGSGEISREALEAALGKN